MTIGKEQPWDKKVFWQGAVVVLGLILIFQAVFDIRITVGESIARLVRGEPSLPAKTQAAQSQSQTEQTPTVDLTEEVVPSGGITLPVTVGDIGKQLMDEGVIDAEKFTALYARRGGLGVSEQRLLAGGADENLTITPQNAGFLLNVFWALGLGNKNAVLEEGPIAEDGIEGAAQFASTGGWSLAKGDTMDHYSKHQFVVLNDEQQKLVERVSQNIYRPCCGNSTYFPDCNHGMAMLGLLELMASQGVSEADMYRAALAVNSYWFPETYLTIAKLAYNNGQSWSDINPQVALSAQYSSSAGYRQVLSQVEPVQSQSCDGGCSV